MNELLTKADLRVFKEEVVTAIRQAARRILLVVTAATAVLNGILVVALRLT
jgi:hypothetical protein